MGQYYKVVNIDRKQAFNGHDYGDGIKLMEFGMSGNGTLCAFAGMLVMDAQQTAPWAGQRVVIAGDYADEGRFLPKELATYNLYSVACGSHLEADDEEAVKRNAGIPAEHLQPYEFVTPEAATAQLKGLGIEMEFGRYDQRIYGFLTDKSFVATQPEDLFEAFEVAPGEQLSLAIGDLLTCLRMSKHQSDVSWCNIDSVDIELDPATQCALALKVRFRNDRSKDFGPAVVNRTLAFPATQAAIVKFFGLKPVTPQLEDKTPARLR